MAPGIPLEAQAATPSTPPTAEEIQTVQKLGALVAKELFAERSGPRWLSWPWTVCSKTDPGITPWEQITMRWPPDWRTRLYYSSHRLTSWLLGSAKRGHGGTHPQCGSGQGKKGSRHDGDGRERPPGAGARGTQLRDRKGEEGRRDRDPAESSIQRGQPVGDM